MNLFAQPWVVHLGWTLLHFLWQGTLIAIMFAVLRALLECSLTARGRYLMACAALAAMSVTPLVTFFTFTPLDAVATPQALWQMVPPEIWFRAAPWLVLAWLGGVAVFSARLIGGWRLASRIRTSAVRPASAEWRDTLNELMRRIGTSRPARLMISSLVDVPTVVGWLRPVILMPVGALTGLPPEYVTALLAHELAHIRRGDYLANVLQSIAEAVLFYHPAVWWLSDQIRAERELCCDDLAVAASGGDFLTYARALAEVESFRPAHAGTAIAADGGLPGGASLATRIRRLIGQDPALSRNLPSPAAVLSLALLWLIGVGTVTMPGATEAAKPALASIALPAPAPLLFDPFFQLPQAAAPQVAAPPAVPPPSPAPVKVHVEGSVVDPDGSPLADAHVTLLGVTEQLKQITDANGKFAFDAAPEVYNLMVERTGFAAQKYGARGPLEDSCDVDERDVLRAESMNPHELREQEDCIRRAPGTTLALEPGHDLKDLKIALSPWGSISGTVTDEAGDPLAGWFILRHRAEYSHGRRVLWTILGGATTKSDGTFRISKVRPGRYYLSTQPNGSGVVSRKPVPIENIPTYYPDEADDAHAAPVDIAPGAELRGINIRVRRVRDYTVRGTLVPDEHGSTATSINIVPIGKLPQRRTIRTGGLQTDFEFDAPPGEYMLQATRVGGGMPQYCFNRKLTISNADVSGIALPLNPCASIYGTLTFDGGGAEAPPRIMLLDRDAYLSNVAAYANPQADGSFQMPQIGPSTYFVDLDLPAGAYVKSARFGSQDVISAPLDFTSGASGSLDVVVSLHGAAVTAAVRNGRGEPMPGIAVTIWPAAARAGSSNGGIFTGRADQKGNLAISGLAPGQYYIAAWGEDAGVRGVLEYPPFLAGFRQEAAGLALAEGSKIAVTLKPVSPERIAAELQKLP